jgi:hypothetical protein
MKTDEERMLTYLETWLKSSTQGSENWPDRRAEMQQMYDLLMEGEQ